jgi:hypothetical protein
MAIICNKPSQFEAWAYIGWSQHIWDSIHLGFNLDHLVYVASSNFQLEPTSVTHHQKHISYICFINSKKNVDETNNINIYMVPLVKEL